MSSPAMLSSLTNNCNKNQQMNCRFSPPIPYRTIVREEQINHPRKALPQHSHGSTIERWCCEDMDHLFAGDTGKLSHVKTARQNWAGVHVSHCKQEPSSLSTLSQTKDNIKQVVTAQSWVLQQQYRAGPSEFSPWQCPALDCPW